MDTDTYNKLIQEDRPAPTGLLGFLNRNTFTLLALAVLLIVIAAVSITISFINRDYMTMPDFRAVSSIERQLYQEGKYEEAIEIGLDLAERGRDKATAYLHLGNCYYHLNDFPKAEECYLTSLRNGPFKLPGTMMNLGFISFKQGQYIESAQRYGEALAEHGYEFPSIEEMANAALDLVEKQCNYRGLDAPERPEMIVPDA